MVQMAMLLPDRPSGAPVPAVAAAWPYQIRALMAISEPPCQLDGDHANGMVDCSTPPRKDDVENRFPPRSCALQKAK